MFGIFKSKHERAVDAAAQWLVDMLKPLGQMHRRVLQDSYCLGFLQIVGIHAASKPLGQGAGMNAGALAFEDAMKQIAPRYGDEAAEMLSFIKSENSPQNGAYLSGRKDGDLYMGWKLLGLAPQSHGAAALERFFERARELDRAASAPPPPPWPAPELKRRRPSAPPPITPAPPAPPGRVRVDWGDWTIVGSDLVRQYDFQNLPFAERLMLQVRLTVEMGSFGFPHTHTHMVMQPPVSQEREITRIIIVDSEDGSVEVGPLQVTIALVPGDASMIWFFGDTGKKLLTVLWSMKRIRFLLLEPDEKTIQMALPLETGPDYREALARIQNQVTGRH